MEITLGGSIVENLPIALQLYSLRDMAQEDFLKTLELTADLGYEGVEFAGYFGLESGQLRDRLDELGLVAVSSHVSYERLTQHLDEEIEYNLSLGNYTLVCPAPPRGFVADGKAWARLGQELSEVGKKLSDHGLRLGYHNHSKEFEKYGGLFSLDILLDAADPRYLFAQLDLGWTLYAGVTPAQYLKTLKGRCPLVHVKDFDGVQRQTDVGMGTLDLPGILRTADEVGVEWLIIETEEYAVSPLHSVEVGLANLSAAQENLS